MSEWIERESGSNIWLPKDKGEELVGKIKECIEEGMYGKNWIIENADGEIMTPSHKVLQNRMAGLKEGAEIKIVYEGEESSGKGNPTRLYKVFTKGG